MLTLSSTLIGLKGNYHVLDIDINDGLKTVGNVKIIIDKEYQDKLKNVESSVRRAIK